MCTFLATMSLRVRSEASSTLPMAARPSSFNAESKPSLVRKPTRAPFAPALKLLISDFALELESDSKRPPSSSHCARSRVTSSSLYMPVTVPSSTTMYRTPSSTVPPAARSLMTIAFAMSFLCVEENCDITGHILRPLLTKAVSSIFAKLLPKISFRSLTLMHNSSVLADLPSALPSASSVFSHNGLVLALSSAAPMYSPEER
mmetsp:Transcript_15893/g.27026  ORF Transcript_15893/g.27026 Transcript_15893/m.27026 type:complete len:203 (+) Transcript_15893:30-638(+)